MSLHPSLRKAGTSKANKTVMKRSERIKWMKERDRWNEDTSKVYGLPKIKVLKVKAIKKEKAAAEKPAEGAAADTAASAAATAAAKPAAGKTAGGSK